MVSASRAAGAEVLLVGMRMPPNLGRAYTEGFEANYRVVARDEGATLLPFLLAPIATDRDAFQADNLHPTAAVQPRILDHVWKALQPLLSSRAILGRSERRRGGKECVSTCRYRWAPYH